MILDNHVRTKSGWIIHYHDYSVWMARLRADQLIACINERILVDEVNACIASARRDMFDPNELF